MPRNPNFRGGGRGRGRHRGTSARSNNNNNTQLPPQPDEWHNSASPACQRLTQIVEQDLGLGRVVERADRTDPQAPSLDAPRPIPTSGWPALVRDYLLWGNGNQQQQSPDNNAEPLKLQDATSVAER